jgi:hypothetical protein
MYRVDVRGSAVPIFVALPEQQRSVIMNHLLALARAADPSWSEEMAFWTDCGRYRLCCNVAGREHVVALTDVKPKPPPR